MEEEKSKSEEQSKSEVLSVELLRGAENRLPSGDPGPVTEEELAFGGNVGLLTERRPVEYRRKMVKVTDETLADMRRELRELGLNQLIFFFFFLKSILAYGMRHGEPPGPPEGDLMPGSRRLLKEKEKLPKICIYCVDLFCSKSSGNRLPIEVICLRVVPPPS